MRMFLCFCILSWSATEYIEYSVQDTEVFGCLYYIWWCSPQPSIPSFIVQTRRQCACLYVRRWSAQSSIPGLLWRHGDIRMSLYPIIKRPTNYPKLCMLWCRGDSQMSLYPAMKRPTKYSRVIYRKHGYMIYACASVSDDKMPNRVSRVTPSWHGDVWMPEYPMCATKYHELHIDTRRCVDICVPDYETPNQKCVSSHWTVRSALCLVVDQHIRPSWWFFPTL